MFALREWVERITPQPTSAVIHSLRLITPTNRVFPDTWGFFTIRSLNVPVDRLGREPSSVNLLQFVDPVPSHSLNDRVAMTSAFAALFSVASERAVEVLLDQPVTVAGQMGLHFPPLGAIADRSLAGPLPVDVTDRAEQVLRRYLGLDEKAALAVGRAAELHYNACLVSAVDLSAAYAMLVMGIEALAEVFGPVPTWETWPAASEWDEFVRDHGLSLVQAAALRTTILSNFGHRPTYRFATYASTRPRDAYWSKRFDEWMTPTSIANGQAAFMDAMQTGEWSVESEVPRDRKVLRDALQETYSLRSGLVHAGRRPGYVPGILKRDRWKDALTFRGLRSLLHELIETELADAIPAGLPDLRLDPPASPATQSPQH